MTKLWRGDVPDAGQIEEIAAVLREGGVVLLPTDTIYGLHARATDVAAVERVCDIKGRDDTKPFVVLAASWTQVSTLPVELRKADHEALASIWPAPLTAILPLREPVAASRGTASIAVRVPDLPWLRSLAERTGPLVSTSANRSGEPPVSSPSELAPEVTAKLDGVFDAGVLTGEPSTIVDFTGGEPRIVREGHKGFTQKVWKMLRKSL